MIYLDFNATNPLRPQVRAAMEDPLGEIFGNPSSVHGAGRLARGKKEQARGTCLRALGDPSGQLIFTSGGTEADNLALTGVARSFSSKGNHLIISAVEHHAVLHPAQALIKEGIDLTIIPVNDVGRVNVQEIQRAISPRTILISIMHANNEVGTIQPISEIAHMAHSKGILFHTDAVQSFGKISVNAKDLQVDMASISAHKIGGPKGSGALYVRRGIKISPLLYGGPHERNMRAGTENVPGIVGLGAAVELAVKE